MYDARAAFCAIYDHRTTDIWSPRWSRIPQKPKQLRGLEVVVRILKLLPVLVSIAVCFVSLIIIEIWFLEKFATIPDRAAHQNPKKPSIGAEIVALRAMCNPSGASMACMWFLDCFPMTYHFRFCVQIYFSVLKIGSKPVPWACFAIEQKFKSEKNIWTRKANEGVLI